MKRIALLAAVVGAFILLFAQPASAHPLGNFSVNQLASFTFAPDRVTVAGTIDLAELPTLQEKPSAGTAPATCAAFAADLAVTVDGDRLKWTVSSSGFASTPGSAGLSTSRFSCTMWAPAALADPSTVDIANGYRADRIGWRELTATGSGVHFAGAALPSESVSGGLTAYPQDLLASPLDVRTAHLRVEPGGGTGPAAAAGSAPSASRPDSWLAGAESTLRGWVADPHLSPAIGVLAVLLSLALGAAHAALPGHGKTVMAAYLAGRHGRPRDAVAVGATVTATHTGGVLILGLLLTSVAGLAGEKILGWLGLASGALIAILGAAMLVNRRRGGPAHGTHSHGLLGRPHTHAPHGHASDVAAHGHDGHSHDHGDGAHSHVHPDHSHPHEHSHDVASTKAGVRAPSRLSIVAMGIAGGLVPSPSALIVLLGAIALGRTWFGVLLVLGYGVGMAATLTAAGLLLIRVQDRWSKRLPRLTARLSRVAPTGTAALVLLVGLGLAGRALITL
jgi:nickel/cobalt exporter